MVPRYNLAMALPAETSQRNEALQRLHRGEVSLDQYLDEQVERALALVKGRISDDRLAIVRRILHDTIRTDPVVVEVIRRATGQLVSDATTATTKT